jgi:hypothetical protein
MFQAHAPLRIYLRNLRSGANASWSVAVADAGGRMNQLAVFPSNAVARWIEPELLERERDLARERPRHTSTDYSPADFARRYSFARAPGLRYRPFERLLSLLTGDAHLARRARVPRR